MNDVEEEKDVGKKVDTCVKTVKALGHEIAGVVLQWKVGENFESDEDWECDEEGGSMKVGS